MQLVLFLLPLGAPSVIKLSSRAPWENVECQKVQIAKTQISFHSAEE